MFKDQWHIIYLNVLPVGNLCFAINMPPLINTPTMLDYGAYLSVERLLHCQKPLDQAVVMPDETAISR